MSEENSTKLSWKAPEYHRPTRKKHWYIITAVLVLIMLFFCFFTIQSWHLIVLGYGSNFLFALIIIIATIVMLINENQPAVTVHFELDKDGLKIGQKFYNYDDFKNFSIVYKPNEDIKNLYLEFKNSIRPRISIPLMEVDALEIRDFLLRSLEEDLDRTDPPLSEQLTKLLKL